MYCRTEISWLYWSRGEASFLSRLSYVKTGSWTMLGCGGVLKLLIRDQCQMNPRAWCAWV